MKETTLIIMAAVLVLLSLLRTCFSARILNIQVGFKTALFSSSAALLVSLPVLGILGALSWPTLAMMLIHGGIPSVMIITLLLLCVSTLPGYFVEKHILKKSLLEENVAKKLALAGFAYEVVLAMLLLGLPLITLAFQD